MYCKDLLVVASGLCFCLIGGEAFAFKASNFQRTQIFETNNFYHLSSLHFSPAHSSQRISQNPSPRPTNTPNDSFSAEMERCKGIRQIGEQEFCMGQALVRYGRLDEAKDHLRKARDTFRANGKTDRANEVEVWASANGVPLSGGGNPSDAR